MLIPVLLERTEKYSFSCLKVFRYVRDRGKERYEQTYKEIGLAAIAQGICLSAPTILQTRV